MKKYKPRFKHNIQAKIRYLFEEIFNSQMKASSDWFQFGEATSIPKSKHFQENIKAQFQIKFHVQSLVLFAWSKVV